MAINTARVVAGGLVAGVVANIVDVIGNGFVLKSTYTDALNALKPGLGSQMAGGGTIATFVILDFILGLLSVFLYASIRPRFGPGPKTAVYAGLLVWAIGAVVWAFATAMGVFPWSLFGVGAIEAIISSIVSVMVGAMIYKEEAAA